VLGRDIAHAPGQAAGAAGAQPVTRTVVETQDFDPVPRPRLAFALHAEAAIFALLAAFVLVLFFLITQPFVVPRRVGARRLTVPPSAVAARVSSVERAAVVPVQYTTTQRSVPLVVALAPLDVVGDLLGGLREAELVVTRELLAAAQHVLRRAADVVLCDAAVSHTRLIALAAAAPADDPGGPEIRLHFRDGDQESSVYARCFRRRHSGLRDLAPFGLCHLAALVLNRLDGLQQAR